MGRSAIDDGKTHSDEGRATRWQRGAHAKLKLPIATPAAFPNVVPKITWRIDHDGSRSGNWKQVRGGAQHRADESVVVDGQWSMAILPEGDAGKAPTGRSKTFPIRGSIRRPPAEGLCHGERGSRLRRGAEASSWLRRTDESRDLCPDVASWARARNRLSLLEPDVSEGKGRGERGGERGERGGESVRRCFGCATATLETALGPIQMQPSPAPWSCVNAGQQGLAGGLRCVGGGSGFRENVESMSTSKCKERKMSERRDWRVGRSGIFRRTDFLEQTSRER